MLAFCLACAKYDKGDALGQLLAVAATSPYFAVYHTAVLLHARRELHMAFVLIGLLLTSVLSSAIKSFLRHPRPAACKLLGNCHKHGMPSSHSAVMAFAATTCLLLYLHRHAAAVAEGGGGKKRRSGGGVHAGGSGSDHRGGSFVDRVSRGIELLEVQALLMLTAAVAYGRVYLQYHSAEQVLAGLALGASLAVAWWAITLAVCGRCSGWLLRLAPLRALHIRNTLGCANIHAKEAALFAAATAAASPRRRRRWW